jgi:type II secretory pathway component GspD/PulD (secretin)
MTSFARVKDGQTTLVAGVSQNIESKTIKGLPLIGLIPILGRFFSTPETNNRQSGRGYHRYSAHIATGGYYR